MTDALNPAHFQTYPTNPTNILEKCKAELDPQLRESFDRESFWWQAAHITAQLALSLFVVGGFIATALYAAPFIPLAGIGALVIYKTGSQAIKSLKKSSEEAHLRTDQLGQIRKYYDALCQTPDQELRAKLRTAGITTLAGHSVANSRALPENYLRTLAPLFARYVYWMNQTADLDKQGTDLIRFAAKEKEEKNRFKALSKAAEIESLILESKIKNAFIGAAIQFPCSVNVSLDDIGEFSPLSGQERAIQRQIGIADAENVFTFHSANIAPIGFAEAKNLSVPELALRILPVLQ